MDAPIETAAATPAAPLPRPEGEYAIVEVLGHRTIVGRIREVERFGAKLLAIEPIWQDALLPAVLIGGGSIYQMTPRSPDVAFVRQPRQHYQLPPSIGATVPAPAPAWLGYDGGETDDVDERIFDGDR